MQSQDLGKPQIPPTFLAGRDFGLYCLTLPGGQVLWQLLSECELYLIPENTRGAPRGLGQTARRALLAYGVDEDDSEGHEEGDDGEGDLQDLLDDFFALDVGEATLFEQAGAVLLMMFRH